MDVLALDGAFNGHNITIKDTRREGDFIVVGEGDEAETYVLTRWAPGFDELVLMKPGARLDSEMDAEREADQFVERMSMGAS